MEKNYSSAEQDAFDPALSIPHFDEDATLLSARPVVPLDELKPENRSRRLVVFGLTILAAILVGAISATLLLIQNTQTSQSAKEVENSQPIVPSSGASGGSTSGSAEIRVADSAPEKALQTKEVTIAGDSPVGSVKKRQNTVVLRNEAKPDRIAKPDYENDQINKNDNSELRAERRQARREARRERRRQREQNGDDLLRIREIFEGSPRP